MTIIYIILLSLFVSGALSGENYTPAAPFQHHITFEIIPSGNEHSAAPNIAYQVSYDTQIFKRNENCRIKEERYDHRNRSIEVVCSGRTVYQKVYKNDLMKNITDTDDYSYGSTGFKHSFIETGNGEVIKSENLQNSVKSKRFFVEAHYHQTFVYGLRYKEVDENTLLVRFSYNSSSFQLIRNENFTVAFDKNENTYNLNCNGNIMLLVAGVNQDKDVDDYIPGDEYFGLYKEEFTICGQFDFTYVTKKYYKEFFDDYVNL